MLPQVAKTDDIYFTLPVRNWCSRFSASSRIVVLYQGIGTARIIGKYLLLFFFSAVDLFMCSPCFRVRFGHLTCYQSVTPDAKFW